MNWFRQTTKHMLAATLPSQLLLVKGRGIAGPSVRGTTTETHRATQIALTFDDGPHPEQTPRLLDYLAAAEIVGTFFVIGEQAERHPDIIRRIVDEGHALGNHTYTHSEPRQTSAADFLDEVARTRSLLQDLTGDDCQFVRPPKGKLTPAKFWGLWKQQQTIVLWNVDPKDFGMRSRRDMEQWCDSYAPATGDIVLMHDNHPHAAVAIETLPFHSASQSLEFVRIFDWFANPVRPLDNPAMAP